MVRCRYKQGFLITVSTVMVLLLSTVQLSLAQNRDNRVVFMSDRDGNREIYTMNPDGGDVRRLTNNDAQDLQPVWSPDKTRIAFVSNRDGNFGMYVMNADGSNQRQISLDESAYHEYPAWSPDGRYLAYASDKAGSFDIYTVEVNGGNPQRLTTGDTDETEPAWSPDGCKIAFLQQVEGAFEIFLMGANGGTPERLAQSSGGDYFSPRWSPDGTRLAYALTIFDQAGNSSEIYVRDMASGDESLLISRENSFVQGIAWSKDGNEILYQVKEPQGNWAIQAVNTYDTGGELFRVITSEDFNSETPVWFTSKSDTVNCSRDGGTNTTCPGAMATFFSPGDTAVVDFNASGALRILTDYKGGAGRTIAQLYDNNRVELLEGPACYNSVNYWKIYYRPINAYGWIAEGRNNDRFLCPESSPECS